MNRKIVATGALLGLIAIVFGAFGAHKLKEFLTPDQLASFETGVRYQMYHALFLLFIGRAEILTEKTKNILYYLVLFGVILFSGSIYLLATRTVTNVDFSVIGFITPIGGLLMIVAWGMLFLNILKRKA